MKNIDQRVDPKQERGIQAAMHCISVVVACVSEIN